LEGQRARSRGAGVIVPGAGDNLILG
jgi:hypothetical protein